MVLIIEDTNEPIDNISYHHLGGSCLILSVYELMLYTGIVRFWYFYEDENM